MTFEQWFEAQYDGKPGKEMSKPVLGPLMEVGICDSCVFEGDLSKRPVHRIQDDNIYFCKKCWSEHKSGMEAAGFKTDHFLVSVGKV